jgi:SAM-dependent methyltransferase
MTEATSSILGHYGAEDLVNRIMRALAAAGYNTVSPTVEMLNLIDQLHGGGLNSTKVQAEMAGVAKDMRILDAGCGVGGSSRYLAHTYRCQVEAIDLTPRYVEAAVRLNELCGLDKKIVVRQGSVTDLPYTDRTCFDDPKRT